jgi:hypothetical protein
MNAILRAVEDKRRPALVEGVDYYLDGPYLVFTEAFLRRRGYCCESGCRHCPYGFSSRRRSDLPDDSPES